jgi:DICT domain-containing protein/predicted DNA-binding transcriptional regulator AlpA
VSDLAGPLARTQNGSRTDDGFRNPMTTHPQTKLRIKDVAEGTGVAAATIRMWEQRYGFPTPSRTPSGYRVYTDADIEQIRTVTALRHRGLSITAAIDRVRATADETSSTGHPSIYAAVAALDPVAHPQVLRRSTLSAMSHAIEDELLARGARGIVVGAFQRTPFYAPAQARYEKIAQVNEATIVFADFDMVSAVDGAPIEVPIAASDALGNEWAVVVDTPTYSACLLAWERPNRLAGHERQFEAVLSLDPRVARRAAGVAAWLASQRDAQLGARLTQLIQSRPLPSEAPAATLTALSNRMVAYLDPAATP